MRKDEQLKAITQKYEGMLQQLEQVPGDANIDLSPVLMHFSTCEDHITTTVNNYLFQQSLSQEDDMSTPANPAPQPSQPVLDPKPIQNPDDKEKK